MITPLQMNPSVLVWTYRPSTYQPALWCPLHRISEMRATSFLRLSLPSCLPSSPLSDFIVRTAVSLTQSLWISFTKCYMASACSFSSTTLSSSLVLLWTPSPPRASSFQSSVLTPFLVFQGALKVAALPTCSPSPLRDPSPVTKASTTSGRKVAS